MHPKIIAKAAKAATELFECFDIKLQEETPERFVKMLCCLTQNHNVSNEDIARDLNKIFPLNQKADSKNMVTVKNIDAFSLCEHHVALMYDMKISVAYIPHDFVAGLSKIVRAVDMVCKRLQLQEKIGEDAAEVVRLITKSPDVAVHICAKHSCVTARGIQNVSSETVTTTFLGVFCESSEMRQMFLNAIK